MYIDTTEILQLDSNNDVPRGSYWNYAKNLPNARANFKLASINNVVYLIGINSMKCLYVQINQLHLQRW